MLATIIAIIPTQESAYFIGENYEVKSKKEDIKKQIYSSEKFTINYLVYGSFLPCIDRELLTEKIELKQHGVIEIKFVDGGLDENNKGN